MLDRALVRSQPDQVKQAIARKGLASPVDDILSLDGQRREILVKLEALKADRNKQSETIKTFLSQGKQEEAEEAKAAVRAHKQNIEEMEEQERAIETLLRQAELEMPNMPHVSVPDGLSEDKNVIQREWGNRPSFEHKPKPHWEIAESLQMIDFTRGAKISGSGFAVYTGWGAKLQRALINFMIDHQTRVNGYTEIFPPYLVNATSLQGTGQLPKFEEDLYKAGDDLYLIPTAEVPVTNLYRDEILDADRLPMKMAAYSACFRKEAGAAGKDTRGLLRMHQFDKVELVKYSLPENSYDELESLVVDAESILQELGLHYRVTLLCAGEMSFSNTKCYDLELWSPGVEKYLEISSCSNFEAFQARRANIRFRRAQGEKPEFIHILNGSGLATPRLFAALLETYWRPDGTVQVPEPLRPYLGTDLICPSPAAR